eukprot:NODE_34_length_36538_cov_0.612854.p11 type:complete len:375 gc:universal NODE_34_length_36538_cov_0.612854:28898-27774(-)
MGQQLRCVSYTSTTCLILKHHGIDLKGNSKKMSIPLTIDSLKNYYIIDRVIGEGTFSKVVRGKRMSDDNPVALKVFKKKLKSILDVDYLREVQIFKVLGDHPNIIKIHRMIYDPLTCIFCLDLELMDINLYEYLSKKYINEEKAKFIIHQSLKGLEYIHSKGFFHRDVKPENILLNIDATIVKIADLGSCARISAEVRPLTQYIATRWYRAPENLLTSGLYNEKMDIWGLSCILFEMMTKKPLFPGKNAIEQLLLIHKAIGSPSDQDLIDINHSKTFTLPFTFPKSLGYGIKRLFLARPSEDCIKFIEESLIYSPLHRPTASTLLKHSFLISYSQRKEEARLNSSDAHVIVISCLFRNDLMSLKLKHINILEMK